MELLSRPKNDRYTKPGEYNELERRLQRHSEAADIPCLVCYAFDMRTRLGPFLYADMRLLTAGPRAVGGALYNAGFTNTRIVLGQWTRNIRPSLARLDGKVPQMLFVSSMQIHSAHAYRLIADSYQLAEDRPLVFAGGAKAIYEPWDFFGFTVDGKQYSADVVCTGEEFVLLQMLDRIMEHKVGGEHPRKTFHRLRRSGLLDDIQGIVFREGDEKEPLGRLVNTGIQRMVQNLDELPMPVPAMALIEPPHRRATLARNPLALKRIRKHSGMASLVTTHGCKFHCPYCPIPAYNQFTFRFKSPERLRDEMISIIEATNVDAFFGTDDNFFNNRETVHEIFEVLSRSKVRGKPFRDNVWFGTEATEFDVHKNQDLLPLVRDGGLRAIWFGIEDMTAELVKKGQSPEKTKELFQLLSKHGIAPMAMMMHHDGQPLASRGNLYGLLNQVKFLRKTGAASVQVTILVPSVGSKGYEQPYEDGMVIRQAGSEKTEDFRYDGNHCIATHDPNPWRKQVNLYLAYASFYNPLNFVRTIWNWRDPSFKVRLAWQICGMVGVVRSLKQGWKWLWNLYKGPIQKMEKLPERRLIMVPPPVTPARVAALQAQAV
jgi:radical SAM superfamily enzyme YgiQ (UPF0313 family)